MTATTPTAATIAACLAAYNKMSDAEEHSMGVAYRTGRVSKAARAAETRAIEAFDAFSRDVKRAMFATI